MKQTENQQIKQQGLYDKSFEHDNCGIGAVVNVNGKKEHRLVNDALKIVENLEHRAGKDAEGKTGDGVGILTQIPHCFFKKECEKLGIRIGEEREYGVGMFFFPQNELKRSRAKKMFEIIVEKEVLDRRIRLMEESGIQFVYNTDVGKDVSGEDTKGGLWTAGSRGCFW